MGLDSVKGFDTFNAAIAHIESIPGAFADDAERAAFKKSLEALIAKEADVAKKLKLANTVVKVVEDLAAGGLNIGSLKALVGF